MGPRLQSLGGGRSFMLTAEGRVVALWGTLRSPPQKKKKKKKNSSAKWNQGGRAFITSGLRSSQTPSGAHSARWCASLSTCAECCPITGWQFRGWPPRPAPFPPQKRPGKENQTAESCSSAPDPYPRRPAVVRAAAWPGLVRRLLLAQGMSDAVHPCFEGSGPAQVGGLGPASCSSRPGEAVAGRDTNACSTRLSSPGRTSEGAARPCNHGRPHSSVGCRTPVCERPAGPNGVSLVADLSPFLHIRAALGQGSDGPPRPARMRSVIAERGTVRAVRRDAHRRGARRFDFSCWAAERQAPVGNANAVRPWRWLLRRAGPYGYVGHCGGRPVSGAGAAAIFAPSGCAHAGLPCVLFCRNGRRPGAVFTGVRPPTPNRGGASGQHAFAACGPRCWASARWGEEGSRTATNFRRRHLLLPINYAGCRVARACDSLFLGRTRPPPDDPHPGGKV